MGDGVLFDAMLMPNPPLRRRWLLLILGGVAGLSFCAGVAFVLRGAWPVTPFFGADVALLAWALEKSARAAQRRERLLLTYEALVIERIDPNGQGTAETLNPYWLKVEHEDPEGVGCELALVARERRWVVGSFLGAEERASLAEALRDALYQVRHSFPRT
jgi:uncharacterized membrane protein